MRNVRLVQLEGKIPKIAPAGLSCETSACSASRAGAVFVLRPVRIKHNMAA